MTVRRIVANIGTDSIEAAKAFYGGVLGMTVAMDLGWIVTFATDALTTPQVSVAVEGGSGTPVPDISVEVDNLERFTSERSQRASRSNMVRQLSRGASSASTCVTPSGDCSTS